MNSRQFAAYLLGELQLKKGDRVALMMPNCLQYPIATFGILRAGLTVVNVNPLYTGRELKHQLVDAGACVLVAIDNFGNTVEQVISETPVRQVITTGLGDMLGFLEGPLVNFVVKYIEKLVPEYRVNGAVRFRDTLALGAKHTLPQLDIEGDDIAFLQYTGGTTGGVQGRDAHPPQPGGEHAAGACLDRGDRQARGRQRGRHHRAAAVPHLRFDRERPGLHEAGRLQPPDQQPARHAGFRQGAKGGASP